MHLPFKTGLQNRDVSFLEVNQYLDIPEDYCVESKAYTTVNWTINATVVHNGLESVRADVTDVFIRVSFLIDLDDITGFDADFLLTKGFVKGLDSMTLDRVVSTKEGFTIEDTTKTPNSVYDLKVQSLVVFMDSKNIEVD